MATGQNTSGGIRNEPDLLRMGQRVAGYEVLQLLGRGGMGQVYQARQLSLDRIVALKVLSPKLAMRDPMFAKRFVEEARAAGRLNHPNLVHVHDVGTAESKDGQPIHFFSMEFIEGSTVQGILDLQGKVDEGTIGKIMIGMGEALVYAHKNQLVHRDIKPDNIMIARDGTVKLADLGLAVRTTDADALGAQPGQRAKVMGTPLYLSPEQAQAKPLDHRCDQYCLGATLFHMLTGEPPYRGADSSMIMTRHVRDPIPDPAERNDRVSDTWRGLCLKLLSKEPEQRFNKPEELREVIVSCSQELMHPIILDVLAEWDGAAVRQKWAASARAAMSGGKPGARGAGDHHAGPPRWVAFTIAGVVGVVLGLALMPLLGSKSAKPTTSATAKVDLLLPFADALQSGQLKAASQALVGLPLGTPEVIDAQKQLDQAVADLTRYLQERIALARDKREVDQLLTLAKEKLTDKAADAVKVTASRVRATLPDEAPPISLTRAALATTGVDAAKKAATAVAAAVPQVPQVPAATAPAVPPAGGPPAAAADGRPPGYPANLPWPPRPPENAVPKK